jgi:hypothetical protein
VRIFPKSHEKVSQLATLFYITMPSPICRRQAQIASGRLVDSTKNTLIIRRPVNKSHKRRDSITAFSSGNRDTVPKFNETLERTIPTKTKGKSS